MAHRDRLSVSPVRSINLRSTSFSHDVEIIEQEPQLVAAIKIHANLSRIANDIGSGFGTLVHALGREGVPIAGAPLIIYHQVIDEETDGDLEIYIPITAAFTGDEGVYSRDLEGGTMATTVHPGHYEEIAPAYHTLTGWVSKNGHGLTGPPREGYLNDPQAVPPMSCSPGSSSRSDLTPRI